MIRYIFDEAKHEFTAAASGSPTGIASELGVLVSTSYNLIRSRDPQAAEAFRMFLLSALMPDSPVWDKEDVKKPQEGIKIVRVMDFGKEGAHE